MEAERGRELDDRADGKWGVAHGKEFISKMMVPLDGAFGKAKSLTLTPLPMQCVQMGGWGAIAMVRVAVGRCGDGGGE